VDVQYRLHGRDAVATGLDIIPPKAPGPSPTPPSGGI
jgi:hypothetical protein